MYPYHAASKMIMQMTMNRLKKHLTERDFCRIIMTRDWIELQMMNNDEARELLNLSSIHTEELVFFETSFRELKGFKRIFDDVEFTTFEKISKQKQYLTKKRITEASNVLINEMTAEKAEKTMKKTTKKTTKDRKKSISNELSSKDFMKIEVLNEPDEKKRTISQCKCWDIYSSFLITLMWLKHDEIEIKSDLKCMKVLRKIIQCQIDEKRLKHVCHRHFHTLTEWFELRTKQLNIEKLLFRFLECWEHRSNLNVLKTNKVKSFWFKLQNRSTINKNVGGIYSQVIARFSIESTITNLQRVNIVDEICRSSTWTIWHRNENLIISHLFSWL